MSTQLLQDLRATRELLAPEGKWTKKRYRTDEGCHCLAGAVYAVTNGDVPGAIQCKPRPKAVFRRLVTQLAALNPDDEYLRLPMRWISNDPEHSGEGSLIEWNDKLDRTKSDVLQLLDVTIQEEEAKQ